MILPIDMNLTLRMPCYQALELGIRLPHGGMGIGPIAGMAVSYISSLLSGSTGSTASAAQASTPAPAPKDTSHLSSFAQILGSLQQVQQSSPAQYSQITNQIAANLGAAAQAATSSGNSGAASRLTSLSKEFQTAAATGQLPISPRLAETLRGSSHYDTAYNAATDPLSIIGNTLSSAGIPASAS